MSVYHQQVGGDHYKKMTIQPAVFINKNKLDYAEGCVIKYICRHTEKGGRTDIRKAIQFCNMIIERDYSDTPHFSVSLAQDSSELLLVTNMQDT